MGRLWWGQEKFDRNGDGKLNSGEWNNWYFAAFGHDIETRERRTIARAEADWNDWLNGAVQVTRHAAEIFVGAACAMLPGRDSEQLAWQALLCRVSAALAEGDQWNVRQSTDTGVCAGSRVFYPYRALAGDLADCSGVCSRRDLERAVSRRRLLFPEAGELTADRCGSFWQQVIAQLPAYHEETGPAVHGGEICLAYASGFSGKKQELLSDLLASLFSVSAFFAGAGESDADRYGTRLLRCFTARWQALRGVYEAPSCFPRLSVEQLRREFPQLRERSGTDWSDADSVDLLEELYDADPARAIELWRSLAGTAAPLADAREAETYFYQLEPIWYNGGQEPELLRPVLEALREETFAKQVFQSAFVNYFHRNILRAALACGEDALATRCLELLWKNPLPKKKWELADDDLAELRAIGKELAPLGRPGPETGDARPLRKEPCGDGEVLHYCAVELPGIRRTYSYLAGGLPLQAGDWVEVPFGKKGALRRGVVVSVTACTRRTAPWPPEQTKTVLRTAAPPVSGETSE